MTTPQQKPYRAVVLGATGAVGSALVRELLGSPGCASVMILTRRTVDAFDRAEGAGKLDQRVISMDEVEAASAPWVKGCDAAFCTLGAGQPSKLSREELWKVDVDYPTAFARTCRSAGVKHFSLLGSLGANPDSSSHYFRVKGSVEQAVQALGFERVSCFRPSLLATKEVRYGWTDSLSQRLFPLVSRLLPAQLREIAVEDLGRAMRLNAERDGRGVEVLRRPDFMALLKSASA